MIHKLTLPVKLALEAITAGIILVLAIVVSVVVIFGDLLERDSDGRDIY